MFACNATVPICVRGDSRKGPSTVSLRRHVPAQRALTSKRPYSVRVLAADDAATAEKAISKSAAAKDTTTKITVFSAAPYVQEFMEAPLSSAFEHVTYVDARLGSATAQLAAGSEVVCLFVNDHCGEHVVEALAERGVKLIAMRCAGYDRVDIAACKKHGIRVARVPAYSPNAVAEQAVGIAMCLARSYHICYNRVREGNFTLSGLERMDIHGKTVAIIGTGKIGMIAAQIFKGFGTKILAYDMYPNEAEMKRIGGEYADMDTVLAQADIISLHCPLNKDTYHLIGKERIAKMKDGVMIINVSRGGLIDTPALIEALETGKVGACGMDVYENEGQMFFKDLSSMRRDKRLKYWDTNIARLMAMPNVLITPHSAFLTETALSNIAATTLENILAFTAGKELVNEVKAQ